MELEGHGGYGQGVRRRWELSVDEFKRTGSVTPGILPLREVKRQPSGPKVFQKSKGCVQTSSTFCESRCAELV